MVISLTEKIKSKKLKTCDQKFTPFKNHIRHLNVLNVTETLLPCVHYGMAATQPTIKDVK